SRCTNGSDERFNITLEINLVLAETLLPSLDDVRSISSNKWLKSSSLASPSVDASTAEIASESFSISNSFCSISSIILLKRYLGSTTKPIRVVSSSCSASLYSPSSQASLYVTSSSFNKFSTTSSVFSDKNL